MPSPALTDFDRVLIVEGYSDLLFYAEVLEVVGKSDLVYIENFRGKGNLLTKLRLFLNPVLLTEKSHIGIIADADDNPTGTFASLKNTLDEITGQQLGASGAWTNGNPSLGILVVPDLVTNGEIETLVWRAWAADGANSQQRTCIETFESCMGSAGFTAHSPSKGLVGSLLAIRNDDDPRLGPGARSGIFDLNHADYNQLRAFLAGF
jgi:hypothetical protein